MFKSISALLICWIFIVLLAVLLRAVALAEFPVGMHHDEAWFGYNAFLLGTNGTNIYGEPWPLTVDMFGDNVSAMHAYVTVPAIMLFGLSVWSIRITVVFFSLLNLLLGSLLFYRLTRRHWLTAGFGVLFALSPWNIIMTRASSTVVIDTAVLLAFLLTYLRSLEALFLDTLVSASSKAVNRRVGGWLLGSYLLAVIAYFTYFTSRLLIIPMALLLLAIYAFKNYQITGTASDTSIYESARKMLPKVSLALLPLLFYLVVPFLIMLPTPYALGRFQQTTVLNSDLVKNQLFNTISRSGQAGLPVEITRAIYNKVTVNAAEFFRHYVGLLSPEVLLFNSGPPDRYSLSGVGAVSWLEMLGLLASVGLFLLGSRAILSNKKEKLQSSINYHLDSRWLCGLFLCWVGVAAIPSSLTLDDFPNLQRAVIVTPFLQMAASIGLWNIFTQFKNVHPRLRRHQGSLFVASLVLLSVPAVIALALGYAVHDRFYQPQYRHGAGEAVSKWILQNAPQSTLLVDHREGLFFLPYFFSEQNLLEQPIEKSGKHYAGTYKIGTRTFVNDLCHSEAVITQDYEYLILYTFEGCVPPSWMSRVYAATYANGSEGFAVLRPNYEVQMELRRKFMTTPFKTEAEREQFVNQSWK